MGRRGWEDVKKHRGIRKLAERLEADSPLRKIFMDCAGRGKAQQKFSLDRMLRETERIYQGIIFDK